MWDLARTKAVIKALLGPPSPSPYRLLQRECAGLLEQAKQAARRNKLTLELEAAVAKLAAAVSAQNVALKASVKKERAELNEQLKEITLSEEECRALPGRMRELDERLFAFSQACDANTEVLVGKLQESLRESMRMLPLPLFVPEGINTMQCRRL